MKTLTVKKLDVVSVANFAAVVSGALALVMVVLSWGLSLLNFAEVEAYFPNLLVWNTGVGFMAMLLVPLVYAATGWVAGAVVSWFYNIALATTSGVKLEVEE